MKNIHSGIAIFKRELGAYFNSPIAYVFVIVFVMLTAILFMTNFFLMGQADMRYFFDIMPLVLCVFIPAITMRLWAEERKGNTFELLLTFPVPTYTLVLGKFVAGLVFYTIALAGTVFIPLMLVRVGHPDAGPIIGGYTGSLLAGAFFLSVGLFISGLCKDQIIAFILTMISCFFLYLSGVDFIAESVDGWIAGLGSFLKVNLGMTPHFAGFEKGVIDTRDLLYFIMMTALFLMLNVLSIQERMKPKAKFLFCVAVIVSLGISLAFNSLIHDIPMGRLDLTQAHVYTISPSTKDIFSKLKAKVLVKLYISPAEKMPTVFKTLEQDVKNSLEELKMASHGRLDFTIIHLDPTQASSVFAKKDSLESRLQQKGIQPFQVQSIEEDAMGIKLIYAAVSIGYKEKSEEIIPRIIPQSLSTLEYDLMSKIYRMTLNKKPVIALVAPYSERNLDPRYMAMFHAAGSMPAQFRDDKYSVLEALLKYEEYDLKRIRLTQEEPLPNDLDTLIVVDPENFNARQRYEIGRFLYEGGNVLIAAQGYNYNYTQDQQGISIMPQKNALGVNELLDNYGVKISDDLLMDAKSQVLSINSGMNYGPFAVDIPVKAPMHITVDRDNMNQALSITGHLSSFLYLWGSALNLDNSKFLKNGLKSAILFTSSKESWKMSYQARVLERTDLEHSGLFDAKLPLGVVIEGQFPNPYQGQWVPVWPNLAPHPTAGAITPKVPVLKKKPGKLLVVGCSRMFEDDIIKQGGSMNLFINAVDVLTLGSALIDIRTHQTMSREVKKLDAMQKLWFRFLTIALIPLVMIVLGVLRGILRRREKNQYMKLSS